MTDDERKEIAGELESVRTAMEQLQRSTDVLRQAADNLIGTMESALHHIQSILNREG
jgi:hypothetical protein